MKKFAIFLVAAMLLILSACGTQKSDQGEKEQNQVDLKMS